MTAKELEQQYKKIGFWALVGVVLILVGMVLTPFATALMWSVVLSVLTYPMYKKLCGRFSETVSALLTIFSTLFLVAIPLGLVGLLVFLQFKGVVQDFEPKATGTVVTQQAPAQSPLDVGATPAPVEGAVLQPNAVAVPPKTNTALTNVAKRVDEFLKPQLKRFGYEFSAEEYVRSNGPELMQRITGPVTKGAAAAAVSAVMMVVAFLTMFFMLKDGHKLLAPAKELLPLPPAWTERILARVQLTIKAVFMGVILVALIQGALAGLGYMIFGVDAWLLWAAATVVLCAVPLLGAPVVYVPLSLVLLSQGKIWQGIALLVWGFGLVSNIDNFLRPKYIGDRVGLHYIAIFFSLLGGVIAFGPVGLIAGPVLLTVALELIAYSREMRTEGQSGTRPDAENTGDAAQVTP